MSSFVDQQKSLLTWYMCSTVRDIKVCFSCSLKELGLQFKKTRLNFVSHRLGLSNHVPKTLWINCQYFKIRRVLHKISGFYHHLKKWKLWQSGSLCHSHWEHLRGAEQRISPLDGTCHSPATPCCCWLAGATRQLPGIITYILMIELRGTWTISWCLFLTIVEQQKIEQEGPGVSRKMRGQAGSLWSTPMPFFLRHVSSPFLPKF